MTTDTLTYPVAPLAPWLQRRLAEIAAREAVARERDLDAATTLRQRAGREARADFFALFERCGIPWQPQRQPMIALRLAATDRTHFGIEIGGLHFTLWQLDPGASRAWLRFHTADGADFQSGCFYSRESFDLELMHWAEARQARGIGADDGH